MALLPLQLEQFLIAKRLVEGGGAAMVSPEEAAPDFAEWFATLLDRAGAGEAAARRAEAHRGHSFAAATKRAAERIAAVASA